MQRKKKVCPIHRKKKKLREIVPEKAQIFNLLDKYFKSIVLNMLKKLKKSRRMMYEQKETITKKI